MYRKWHALLVKHRSLVESSSVRHAELMFRALTALSVMRLFSLEQNSVLNADHSRVEEILNVIYELYILRRTGRD